ncbi:6,7-dimethyl-8-ribityllumazine synthase [Thermodesulfatator indicus DSM 15286]|uniref:6,7-dimethyl-8-ribityllumazine synthase n=1 Tax=Thermodesulfatator indicus (strain DSM 15286 / JCM 11887 / CIR29812) TaxID=667014 RepID=F8AC98_THEID|nr:6,7-dimethyl-8-ribityllumazine synthase [Thermodesulfatator indicus]AEH45733.1 6,7-dimethyl-8-ribityllumazine synthase [Thermodesulfatator indicus DSM 15286]
MNNLKTIEGEFKGEGLRFGIIAGRFNSLITKKLLEGALDALKRHGVSDSNIEVVWVPGSFEIPLVAKKMAQSERYDALICLGTIIRGATPHFDYVAAEASKGIAQVMLEMNVPIAFGILTTDNIEQAIERAGTKAGNKGFDAAMVALEMANLLRKL